MHASLARIARPAALALARPATAARHLPALSLPQLSFTRLSSTMSSSTQLLTVRTLPKTFYRPYELIPHARSPFSTQTRPTPKRSLDRTLCSSRNSQRDRARASSGSAAPTRASVQSCESPRSLVVELYEGRSDGEGTDSRSLRTGGEGRAALQAAEGWFGRIHSRDKPDPRPLTRNRFSPSLSPPPLLSPSLFLSLAFSPSSATGVAPGSIFVHVRLSRPP